MPRSLPEESVFFFNIDNPHSRVYKADFHGSRSCTVFRTVEIGIHIVMKAVFVALFALVAVASANIVLPHAVGYSVGAPLAYAAAPVAYAAPIAYAAPTIQTGYVAANRGAVHTAPLPEGPFAFSHHINTAPAPGTF